MFREASVRTESSSSVSRSHRIDTITATLRRTTIGAAILGGPQLHDELEQNSVTRHNEAQFFAQSALD